MEAAHPWGKSSRPGEGIPPGPLGQGRPGSPALLLRLSFTASLLNFLDFCRSVPRSLDDRAPAVYHTPPFQLSLAIGAWGFRRKEIGVRETIRERGAGETGSDPDVAAFPTRVATQETRALAVTPRVLRSRPETRPLRPGSLARAPRSGDCVSGLRLAPRDAAAASRVSSPRPEAQRLRCEIQ